MKELQGFVIRIESDYLRMLPRNEVVRDCIREIATRTIDLFLQHITLIRVSEDGGAKKPSNKSKKQPQANTLRIRLASDFAQLEKCVCTLGEQAGELGKAYRVLRAFKPLLFKHFNEIAKSPALGELIPHSLIIQHLISWFAPLELQLPHIQRNWSISRYAKWYDQHPDEEDRLLIIKYVYETLLNNHFW